jgi:hypothetical protein
MSYACFTVIYGTYVSSKNRRDNDFMDILGPLRDEDDERLNVEYSGGGPAPIWFGVSLDGFDECEDAISVAGLVLTPSDDQKAEAEASINSLPEEIRSKLPPIGVYFIPSSS